MMIEAQQKIPSRAESLVMDDLVLRSCDDISVRPHLSLQSFRATVVDEPTKLCVLRNGDD
jgi:hypothetical protein